MQRVCVFCGSNCGRQLAYTAAAQQWGKLLAARGLGLVYGGGHIGLMGILADAVLQGGSEVIGVIPQALADRELAHSGLTQLHIVSTMHDRKALMADLADGFVALPGGFGTADEFFEILTWAQLGLHAKPIGLLNTKGFFDPLLAWIQHMVQEDFLRPEHRDRLLVADQPELLIDLMLHDRPTAMQPKWIEPEER